MNAQRNSSPEYNNNNNNKQNLWQQLLLLLPSPDAVVILFMSQDGVKQNDITTLYGAVSKNIVHVYSAVKSDNLLYICSEVVILC
jgi:hypothetical protein